MQTRPVLQRMNGGYLLGRLTLSIFLLAFACVRAQTTIVSTVPANGATGVSTSAGVVFTFSGPMDTSAVDTDFYNDSTFSIYTTTASWNAASTVLTCTPSPAFPTSTEISWVLAGTDVNMNPVEGQGSFTTGTTGGGGGISGISGTNQYTAFGIGQATYYQQTSAAAPALQASPYQFFADIMLSSNISVSSATLELPGASVLDMEEVAPAGQFVYYTNSANQSDLDDTFGNGDYVFSVDVGTANTQVTVDLPSTLAQPGGPQISNFAAAQSVNPAQSFTLAWDPFSGGTSTDYIYVVIGNSAFSSPPPGVPNALAGTATSVSIPANTLQPNTTYDSLIEFYHVIFATNSGSDYVTSAYRYGATEFNLITTSASAAPASLVNASWSDQTFSFNVTSAIGQILQIQYSTNLLASQWKTLLTTTNTTGTVQVTDSVNTANPQVFYRVVEP